MKEENNNEIIFHDENVAEVKKGGKNKLWIVSMVFGILGFVLGLPDYNNDTVNTVIGVGCILLTLSALIIAIVSLSQIKKKNQEGKKYAIISLLIPILTYIIVNIITVIEISNMDEIEKNDLMFCPAATDCVKIDDKTSNCLYGGQKDIVCSNSILKDDQFK